MSPKKNKPPAEGERRKAAASVTNLKKPTRPLTAYHLFFQLEREYILQTTPAAGDPFGGSAPSPVDDRLIGKDIDPVIPYRYRYVRLSPTWHASGSGKRTGGAVKKRKHRRTHGKISFLDLSKRIAARWAGLEENDWATKDYVTRIARRELEAYRRAVREHKRKNNAASADAKAVSMDADEVKLWIERAGGGSSDGTPTDGAGAAIVTATPTENIVGRASAASSSQSQPAMTSFPCFKPEVHNMSYAPAELMPSTKYEAAASTSEANLADLKVNPMAMDADAMKRWIKRTNGRLLDGMQAKCAGKEAATAMLQKNTGSATSASSSQSQSVMPSSFPLLKPEIDSVPYASVALMPPLNCEATSSVRTDADAPIGRKDGAIGVNQQLLDSNVNCTAEGIVRMPVAASGNTLEQNAFNEPSFHRATPSVWKQFRIAEKGGGRRHTSDPHSRSLSFPMMGSSETALYGHGRRETMLPAQPERFRHSFTSTSSLFPGGGSGSSGQGNAHRGVSVTNYELDAFLSRMGQPGDQGQGRGFNFDLGDITPISHRPASASNDICGPSAIEPIEPIEPPPLGLEDAVGMARISVGEMNYELDAFMSRVGRQRDQGQGRGFDFGGIAPIGHRPANAFDDARGPSAIEPIEPPPLGSVDAVGMSRITPEDAVGLMEALSDDD